MKVFWFLVIINDMILYNGNGDWYKFISLVIYCLEEVFIFVNLFVFFCNKFCKLIIF